MAWTNPDRHMHAQHTHMHQTEIVTTMSRSSQAGLTKKGDTLKVRLF